MKFRTKLRRTSFIASLLLSGLIQTNSVRSDINGHDASQAGLAIAWETNIGGAPLAHGKYSFVIWPH